MATDVARRSADSQVETARRLLLIWRNPQTTRLSRVGELDGLVDGRYAFRYAADRDPDFAPLIQFPDLDRIYVSDTLPAFFVNRVMTPQRDDYADYRRWLGFDDAEETPLEVLARTGGGRATDTFHVVDDLQPMASGRVVSRFLASGMRYIDGAEERVSQLRPGQRLLLRDEPDNPVNQRAILIDAEAGVPVARIPDWLVNDVHTLRDMADELVVCAERISLDAPPRLRLLCRLEATVTA